MHNHIFTSTKHWSFSPLDKLAEERFALLQDQTIKELPESFYSGTSLNIQ